MTEKILWVDDDANIVDGFKRQLRKQFLVDTALSGEAGLEALDTRGPFAVIVSDMRMPGMNGAQFLSQARERAPDSVRIMLTGQTDMQAAIAAVNEGRIFRFLTKPCPPEHLVSTLHAALTQYRLITAERTLLEQTLRGCVKVLTDVLALVNPVAFGRASRLKRYARHIATHLGLPEVWQFEVAAMLSQLGCVTLPTETLEKIDRGHPLSPDEHEMVTKHPGVGADLLRHIPRLETIADIIGTQPTLDTSAKGPQALPQSDVVLMGAHLLKVVGEFDRLMTSGLSHAAAIAELQKHPDPYGMIPALQDMAIDERHISVRLVGVCDLSPGMILADDVRTKTDILVIAKGHEVTKVVMERLRSYAQKVEVVEPFRVWVPAGAVSP